MKFIKLSILVMLLLVIASFQVWAALEPAESDAFNGQDAPGFSAQTLDGKMISLSNYKGHPVLLNFFASWCPPCRQEIGEFIKLHKKYGSRGLQIIGAATDSKLIPETSSAKEESDVRKLAERVGIPYPITIADQKLIEAYSFKGIPTSIFIDRKGKIVKVFYGYHNAEAFEGVLDKVVEK
ncbi:MAG: TlpA family protein disulfide reductase [Deltaproteobacteria bacterium]|nr:TlpA family protein disulfide reductase [Deltaproteobacteria bacterium]